VKRGALFDAMTLLSISEQPIRGHVAVSKLPSRPVVRTSASAGGYPFIGDSVCNELGKYVHYAPGIFDRAVHSGCLAQCIDASIECYGMIYYSSDFRPLAKWRRETMQRGSENRSWELVCLHLA